MIYQYERSLRKVATRGVVALFNAIAAHQHANLEPGEEKASARDIKQLSKDNFLQMLKAPPGGATAGLGTSSTPALGAAATGSGDIGVAKGAVSAWLRDDFMSSAGRSVKDWERHDEHGGSDEEESEGESDEGSEDEGQKHESADNKKVKPTNTKAKKKSVRKR